LAEFTGERVVPEQVDADLWNEHRSRYLFAARLCRNKTVLDIGCGVGYGAAELARSAARVIGLDLAAEALEHAQREYLASNTLFVQASCNALPVSDGSFDLVVAFELIEHIADWRDLLVEARRVLAPGGQFIVSTPNKNYYAESRRLSGPNPYHQHEFAFEEFRDELRKVFPHVSLFLQNHGPGIVFQPVEAGAGTEARVEGKRAAPEESNFFIAVCATTPQTGAPTFVHVPTAANVLRERGQHITLLESELTTKDEWLRQAQAEHQQLVDEFRAQNERLEESNLWAEKLNAELDEARARIDQLQAEMDQAIAEVRTGYEAKVAELEEENRTKTEWARARDRDLARCVDLLHQTEKTVEERTAWALRLDERIRELEAKLSMVEASRWIRLGRAMGVGPELRDK
jgi:SAM-dependent methyltransferase